MSAPLFAHIAGIPVEETLLSFAPVLLMTMSVACASVRARLRDLRGPRLPVPKQDRSVFDAVDQYLNQKGSR